MIEIFLRFDILQVVQEELQDVLETMDHQDLLVLLVKLVILDEEETKENLDLDLKEISVKRETMVSQEDLERRDSEVNRFIMLIDMNLIQ